jgi:hypothetical protein
VKHIETWCVLYYATLFLKKWKLKIQIKKETLVGRHTSCCDAKKTCLERFRNDFRTCHDAASPALRLPRRWHLPPPYLRPRLESSNQVRTMYGISSSHVYYIWYIKITILDIYNTWYILYIYIQYLIFGYLMISPIRVGYCVQVRVNMGRCTTDYWWKCGIGNLSQTANGGLRLYTVWSRAASPMRNLWKPGAKSLCICICVHLLYLFILDSRCYSQIKSCHVCSVYQSKN